MVDHLDGGASLTSEQGGGGSDCGCGDGRLEHIFAYTVLMAIFSFMQSKSRSGWLCLRSVLGIVISRLMG